MKIGVLGMGAYGIALANVFYKNENDVCIWTKFKEELDSVSLIRENAAVLPGVKIPKRIELTDNIEKCVLEKDIIVVAIPMNALRDVLKELANYLDSKQVVCLVTKGIEEKTSKFVFEVAGDELNTKNICMLSGPSIAIELANFSPTGFVVVSKSEFANLTVKVCLENRDLIVNTSQDVIGIEVTSAVKNVFAILCGYVHGSERKYSDSLKAAILSKLVTELDKLIGLFGGEKETFLGYAGLGDMLLTCTSDKSRNYTFGKLIGEGNKKSEAMKLMNVKTVEGLPTLEIIYKMLQEKNYKVNSINVLYDIVYKNKKVDNILKEI